MMVGLPNLKEFVERNFSVKTKNAPPSKTLREMRRFLKKTGYGHLIPLMRLAEKRGLEESVCEESFIVEDAQLCMYHLLEEIINFYELKGYEYLGNMPIPGACTQHTFLAGCIPVFEKNSHRLTLNMTQYFKGGLLVSVRRYNMDA